MKNVLGKCKITRFGVNTERILGYRGKRVLGLADLDVEKWESKVNWNKKNLRKICLD